MDIDHVVWESFEIILTALNPSRRCIGHHDLFCVGQPQPRETRCHRKMIETLSLFGARIDLYKGIMVPKRGS